MTGTREQDIAALAAAINRVPEAMRADPDACAERLYEEGALVLTAVRWERETEFVAITREHIVLQEAVHTLRIMADVAAAQGREKMAQVYRDVAGVFEQREKAAAEKLRQQIAGTSPVPV